MNLENKKDKMLKHLYLRGRQMSLLLIGVGVFTLACTYFKPSFYWNSRKARRTRNLFGDSGASIVYYILGGGITIFGLLELLNIVTIN